MSTVKDTPEMLRVKENTKNFSLVSTQQYIYIYINVFTLILDFFNSSLTNPDMQPLFLVV